MRPPGSYRRRSGNFRSFQGAARRSRRFQDALGTSAKPRSFQESLKGFHVGTIIVLVRVAIWLKRCLAPPSRPRLQRPANVFAGR